MPVVSTSTLSWLDSSEHERRSVLELVSALNEPGTLDELGIGPIRDTIADALFPGTSTIQTRARYFLFIPWILQKVEEGSPSGAENRALRLQLQLRNALVSAHGPNEPGVIGREAEAALQRWPLSIYWSGLSRWGIRRQPGSISSYFATLRNSPSWHRALEEPVEGRRDEATDNVRGNWASIPGPPKDFPEGASFELTPDEGRLLRERVVLTHPGSYLAHILQTSNTVDTGNVGYPWDHPAAQTAKASAREWLHDARLFSLVHRGGVLLYNLMLADALEDEDGVDTYSAWMADWSDSMAAAVPDLERWDRASMWSRLLGANPRLRIRTREFANRWYEFAVTKAGPPVGNLAEARRLIRERELELKRERARLTYAEARDRRRGYPTSERLEFRWTQVKRITSDIMVALEQG